MSDQERLRAIAERVDLLMKHSPGVQVFTAQEMQPLLSLAARQAQEIQELRSRLASALAEREEALLSIGGVQSDLRKADQEIQELRTQLDIANEHLREYLAPPKELS